ncbi:DNA mismatch repair protein MutS [Flavobacterium sp.]|uniref:DNA mismatch repair protein MutS n=1 Tax=Flavobacterium sp. TaxID=239 RepID=UPI003B9A220A
MKQTTKHSFKTGDRVQVLDDAVEGVITAIDTDSITIESTDGFLIKYQPNELIKIGETKIAVSYQDIRFAKSIKDVPQKVKKSPFKDKVRATPSFDLHIEKIVQSHKGMSNFDILNLQLETAQRHIEFAIKNRIPKIVLIHGVGAGVLKTELEYLYRKYDQIIVSEASYQLYGQGASELYFKQNN